MKRTIAIPAVKKRRIFSAFLGIILLFAAGIYYYYTLESSSLHDAAARNIQAIGDLKIRQITQWRNERIANARTTFGSAFFVEGVEAWLRHPNDDVVRTKILDRINLVKKEYRFAGVFLESPDGMILLSTDNEPKVDSSEAVMRRRKIIEDVYETDFFMSPTDQRIFYDLIAQLRTADNRLIAAIVFRTNPDDYLYPLIRQWPTASNTSETVLLRQENDSIVYLNDLRFRDHSALRLRMPITLTSLPAVQAALGRRGIFDGYDYRGVRTLSYLAQIPGTPWLMVAKIDYSEIFAELRYRSIILAIMSTILFLLLGSLLIVYYRSSQLTVSAAELQRETERRQYHENAERQIRESREQLAERESEYNTLVESLDEGFCVIEMIYNENGEADDYRFLEVNPAFEKQTGLRQPVGRTARELVPGLDRHWFEIYGKVAATGEPMRFEAPAEVLKRYYDVFAYRIGGKESRRVGVLFTDMSEHLEMEKLLRDVQRREAIGVLSAGIAHDFNNLLSIMMGNVSLAQLTLPREHPACQNMSKALAAMENAAELTRQILAYSGKGSYRYLKIDLKNEIEEYLALFEISKPKNVRLLTKLPAVPIFVNGDPAQIKQVIMNLIINGGEAIGEKQGSITVSLSSVRLREEEANLFGKITGTRMHEGTYALLEVADDGAGIKPEMADKIFDPFFTTKFTGRGLGLSAVLGIIRSHAGGLRVESGEGIGTTFQIILPAVGSPEPEPKEPTGEIAVPELVDPPSILVIDDEEDVASMVKDILEMENYSVFVEVNPIRGIELYKAHQKEIGLVILDFTMPEMSGKEVVDKLHEIDPAVKILITSGYSEDDVAKRVGSRRILGGIQKPYPMELLLSKVRNALRGD